MDSVDKKALLWQIGASMALLYIGRILKEKAQYKRFVRDLQAHTEYMRTQPPYNRFCGNNPL